jgi:hypothetical protein
MVQTVTVTVQKEAYDLAENLVKFLAEIKKALGDGWQPGQDLPVLFSALLADLVPALQAIPKMDAAKKEDFKAFIRAFELAASDAAFLFLG